MTARISLAFILAFIALLVPYFVFAQSPGMGMKADAMCNPVDIRCPCNIVWACDRSGCGCKQPGLNKHNCPPGPNICYDDTAGSMTIGTCPLPGKCQGTNTSFGGSSMGLGGSLGGIVGQLLSGLLQKLMQPEPPEPPMPPNPASQVSCNIIAQYKAAPPGPDGGSGDFTARPASGSASLAVSFRANAGHVDNSVEFDFGDGSQRTNGTLDRDNQLFRLQSHTYTKDGAYTATAYKIDNACKVQTPTASCSSTIGTVRIVVGTQDKGGFDVSWTSTGDVQSAILNPGELSVQPFGQRFVTSSSSSTIFFLTVRSADSQNTCSTSPGLGGYGPFGPTYGPTYGPTDASIYGPSTVSNLLTSIGNSPDPTPVSQFLNNNTPPPSPLSQLINQATGGASTTKPAVPASNLPIPRFASSTIQNVFQNPGAPTPPGITGDIVLLNNGATVVYGSNEPTQNSQTVGFLGTNTFSGEQPTGLVGRLCQTRPWATNFLSSIIPAGFFDGLCSWRGYQVGLTATTTAPQVTVTQTPPRPTQPTATTTPPNTTPQVEAKVDIWAVPASVPLGSRTSIFWNTQGVASCQVTSPDGSFNQTTLSGGASTVPLSGATTYTISCLKADGTPVTDYVTVNLAL